MIYFLFFYSYVSIAHFRLYCPPHGVIFPYCILTDYQSYIPGHCFPLYYILILVIASAASLVLVLVFVGWWCVPCEFVCFCFATIYFFLVVYLYTWDRLLGVWRGAGYFYSVLLAHPSTSPYTFHFHSLPLTCHFVFAKHIYCALACTSVSKRCSFPFF